MHEKNINKLIGYAVMAIFAYVILQAVIPYLIWGVIIWVVFKAFYQFNKHKY